MLEYGKGDYSENGPEKIVFRNRAQERKECLLWSMVRKWYSGFEYGYLGD